MLSRQVKRQMQRKGIEFPEQSTPRLNDYMHIYTLSVALALDSFEIDRETARQIIFKIEENADCILKKYINQEDIEKMLAETYGIDFVKEIKRSNIFVNPDGTIVKG